ncbi:MAG: bifunctional phosphopantothenoylcysteine decarboxylase/phosphopantothenate--cysteine ligase CoaBC [Cyclobacteriaceae bacterium]
MLSDKKILVAVCGSIAAFKTAFFIRLLKKSGAEVKVIMTESASDFITPLTLATLSKNPVYADFFDKKTGKWTSHVELGLWADIMVIAPASANTLAKMATGTCDNLLLATYLSARCPVMVAPAMDLDMFSHPSTQHNLKIIQSFGNILIEPEEGELASGLEGKGRMAEPESLLLHLEDFFKKKTSFKGKKVLITSGPTQEPIDPIRFIGNHSTGKMGKAIAESFVRKGATVHFVTGPVSVFPSNTNIYKVKSAREMLNKVESLYDQCDIVIFTAAVADYRPKNSFTEKKKRDGDNLSVELVENPDIAVTIGQKKTEGKLHVGFALETHNGLDFAKMKLKNKKFDLIILNQTSDDGAGFGHDTNKVTILDKDNIVLESELKSKELIAEDILDQIQMISK